MNNLNYKIKSLVNEAFNLSILRKNRLQWVDYLKGIAILMVVYRHVLLGIQRSGVYIPEVLIKANMIFYSFRMPLFFILSGLFISSSIAKRSFGKLVELKFENLFYPYLIWATIQITLQIVMSGSTNSNRGLIDYSYILYQPRDLDQFWYLPALFNTTVIYLFIRIKCKASHLFQLGLGVILYFLSHTFQSISMISDWMDFYIFFALGDALSPLFFSGKIQSFLKKGWLLYAIIPVFVSVQIYYLSLPENYYSDTLIGHAQFLMIALTGCISMFILSFRLQVWGALRFLRVFGFYSIYIYLMHVIVAAIVRFSLMKFFHIHNIYCLLAIGTICSASIPVIVYNLLIENGIGWFLFAYRKKKKNSETVKAGQNQKLQIT